MKLIKEFPNDLLISLILIFLTIIFVLVPTIDSSIIRAILGLIFVLFLPGYLLICALFPNINDLSGIERIALSFGLSIAVVPLLGLVLNYTPWGIRLVPILTILSFFCIVLLIIAYYQRSKLKEKERFSVPFQFRLSHNETWEEKIALTPDKTGTDMKMELLLFKENNFSEPYRSLHLRVNVAES